MGAVMEDRLDVSSVQGWSIVRSYTSQDKKHLIADGFSTHEFLVPPDNAPAKDLERTASIVVSPGTTNRAVVSSCLEWMLTRWNDAGPFNLTWYTPSMLIFSLLRDFNNTHPTYRSGSAIVLFPGMVDPMVGATVGDPTTTFVDEILKTQRFSYAFLSAHRFDIRSGEAYFFFPSEIGLQRSFARLHAEHKWIFLDSTKFESIEGILAFRIPDLLETSGEVNICTNASANELIIREGFNELSRDLFGNAVCSDEQGRLRLRFVSETGDFQLRD